MKEAANEGDSGSARFEPKLPQVRRMCHWRTPVLPQMVTPYEHRGHCHGSRFLDEQAGASKRASGPEARAAAEHSWQPPVSRTGRGHREGCHQRGASTWHCGASRGQTLELLRELPTRARRGRNLLKFGVCVRGHLPYWVIFKYMITLPHPPSAGKRWLLQQCATRQCDGLVQKLR